MIAFEEINSPEWSMIPMEVLTSLAGMGIGLGIRRLRSVFFKTGKTEPNR